MFSFTLTSKDKGKTTKMYVGHSCVSDVRDFLAELGNSFQILEEYFPIVYTTPNVMATDTNTLLC